MRHLLILIIVFILSVSLNASVAKVTSLSGTASIERASKTTTATLGSDLESKDVIATAANSKVQLTFKDNTIITVGKQSRFSIDEYLFDSTKASTAKFNVISGTIRAMSGKIGTIAPDKFTVKTKTAIIGIRGTDFIVHINADGIISIFCLQGSIIVQNANGNKVIVDAGSYVIISPSGTIDGPHEFTTAELRKLLDTSFFIPHTLSSREKVEFNPSSEQVIAPEGNGEICHPDESLKRGNLPNIDELLTDSGLQMITDTIPTPEPDRPNNGEQINIQDGFKGTAP
jgi:hypothetical protein